MKLTLIKHSAESLSRPELADQGSWSQSLPQGRVAARSPSPGPKTLEKLKWELQFSDNPGLGKKAAEVVS